MPCCKQWFADQHKKLFNSIKQIALQKKTKCMKMKDKTNILFSNDLDMKSLHNLAKIKWIKEQIFSDLKLSYLNIKHPNN